MVFTFAARSRRQYDFIDPNSRVRGGRVAYTDLPQNIVQDCRVVSINNTAEMDL